ncbi:MAG TPA: MqnA/MqnD/SBP family protein [Gemmatimonadales bacterium]|nr:MqnA/MqnD/SBP family protein [Gemmatimonadales bacterium]
MRLLIVDTFATATYTVPVTSNWVPHPEVLGVELVDRLTSETVAEDTAVLASSSEIPRLQQTHVVVGDVAVVADGVGAITMRTPVRPDEVEATPVRLLDTSDAAELLARATLKPFYGIEPTRWVRDDDSPEAARSEVVIVEGAEALREPEGGFSEDLSKAWFILTAQPVVSHVLLVPRTLPPGLLKDIVEFLDAVRVAGHERRRDWRPQLADREGIGRDRASAFWAAQRLRLEETDQRALLDLLQKGSRGTSRPPLRSVEFIEGAETE